MVDAGSVTQLMRDGGEEAFWHLYVRFVLENEQLQAIVRKRLPSDRVADPVDILSDAFQDVWRKSLEGKHREFNDRNNLLGLLTTYAKARADDARKRKRPVGDSSVASGDAGVLLSDFAAHRPDAPSQQELRAAIEEVDDRLSMLSDEHRQIALLTIQGKSQQEIVDELKLANVKRVERAFDAIRSCWTSELAQSFTDAWGSGQRPGFERWLLQFPHGGRWLLREICEIEIHQRLRGELPVSRDDFRGRAHPNDQKYVDDLFVKCLFFDDRPSSKQIASLRSQVEEWFLEVIDWKLAGLNNDQIASKKKCPRKSVIDAMQHLRSVLSTTQAN